MWCYHRDQVKKELEPVISNIMVVGEKRRFLSCLLTLRVATL